MKLNFWQWLGVILLVIGVVMVFRSRMSPSTTDSIPATQQAG